MTDATPPTPPDEPAQPPFTKAPQPELPLEQRRLKAGITKTRIALWVVVGGFALVEIIVGIVGLVTKSSSR
jgi:hypothetical protein